MKHRICSCRDCKRAKRNGKVLGTRIMGFWLSADRVGFLQYYFGPVSDYVRFPKFAKGKRFRKPNRPINFDEGY